MFYKYINKISKLKSFEKKDILNEDFLLEQSENLEIYYAPHNEYINKKAKIIIIGITPGWTQTQIAYKTVFEGISLKKSNIDILKECKYNSRFSGSMRNNLIEMMDQIEINKKFNLNSCSELFYGENDLIHTTSLIKYPVFIKGKNYTGHNPDILNNIVLSNYLNKFFIKEVENLNNVLIIPLGKAVEAVLKYLVDNSLIKDNNIILYGFPHPSGANGHRLDILNQNKNKLIQIVQNIKL